jgi:hypothetical protein
MVGPPLARKWGLQILFLKGDFPRMKQSWKNFLSIFPSKRKIFNGNCTGDGIRKRLKELLEFVKKTNQALFGF